MILRIRLGHGIKVGKKRRQQHKFALGVASLLTPAALLAAVLGLWGIAADMKWTGSFAIPEGLFSHWQVWMGGALALQVCAHVLNRYAKNGQTAAS
jgi:hypothetical protein